MKFARSIFATYAADTGTNVTEIVPGLGVQTDQELEQWVRDTSWGHHASCSCPIGKDGDEMAVLDGKFRVRGAKGLRVVDASVFVSIGSLWGWHEGIVGGCANEIYSQRFRDSIFRRASIWRVRKRRTLSLQMRWWKRGLTFEGGNR